MDTKAKWDIKAASYQTYTKKKNKLHKQIFKQIKKNKIKLKNKKVLDVGCGTGVFALHIAPKCTHITCNDISSQMLHVAKKSAKKYNIKNTKFVKSEWQNLKIKKPCDIAISTLAPVFEDKSAIKKFHKSAKYKICLSWAGKRDSSVQNLIFAHFGTKFTISNSSQKIENFLKSHNIKYKSKKIKETRTTHKTLDNAIKNSLWHLNNKRIKSSYRELKNLLSPLAKNGMIKDKITSHTKLIIWK